MFDYFWLIFVILVAILLLGFVVLVVCAVRYPVRPDVISLLVSNPAPVRLYLIHREMSSRPLEFRAQRLVVMDDCYSLEMDGGLDVAIIPKLGVAYIIAKDIVWE